jgi:hypothetical protein
LGYSYKYKLTCNDLGAKRLGANRLGGETTGGESTWGRNDRIPFIIVIKSIKREGCWFFYISNTLYLKKYDVHI